MGLWGSNLGPQRFTSAFSQSGFSQFGQCSHSKLELLAWQSLFPKRIPLIPCEKPPNLFASIEIGTFGDTVLSILVFGAPGLSKCGQNHWNCYGSLFWTSFKRWRLKPEKKKFGSKKVYKNFSNFDFGFGFLGFHYVKMHQHVAIMSKCTNMYVSGFPYI